jgi:hypothetical protein
MVPKDELLRLNRLGFIPTPWEDQKSFLERVNAWQNSFESSFPIENDLKKEISAKLASLFDIFPEWIQGFYGNQDLSFFQAAATWEIESGIPFPLVQLRKGLKKGAYFKVYDRKEILAHEMTHAPRLLFASKRFEEKFAYLTSSHPWRRWLGPLFNSSKEVYSFAFLCFIPFIYAFFSLPLFYLSWSVLFIPLHRLYRLHTQFDSCLKKLKSFPGLKEKALAVMYRLTDEEIKYFAEKSIEEIKTYIENEKTRSLRWQMIHCAYFC